MSPLFSTDGVEEFGQEMPPKASTQKNRQSPTFPKTQARTYVEDLEPL